MNDADSATALEAAIARYNDAWNAHDLDAIMAMHAPDMVFENHTARRARRGRGRSAATSARSSRPGPTSASTTGALYCREGLVVQEWTATATHANEMRRGDLVAEPTGKRSAGTGST